jgi:membrane glycosyltransferase
MAVADPGMNAVHRGLLGARRSVKSAIREARRRVMETVLAEGPASADAKARRIILNDPDLIDEMHMRVWRIDDDDMSRRWGIGA